MSENEIPQFVENIKKPIDKKEYQKNYNKIRKIKYGIEMNCNCGKIYTKWNENKHFKTVHHINKMKIIELENQLNNIKIQ